MPRVDWFDRVFRPIASTDGRLSKSGNELSDDRRGTPEEPLLALSPLRGVVSPCPRLAPRTVRQDRQPLCAPQLGGHGRWHPLTGSPFAPGGRSTRHHEPCNPARPTGTGCGTSKGVVRVRPRTTWRGEVQPFLLGTVVAREEPGIPFPSPFIGAATIAARLRGQTSMTPPSSPTPSRGQNAYQPRPRSSTLLSFSFSHSCQDH